MESSYVPGAAGLSSFTRNDTLRLDFPKITMSPSQQVMKGSGQQRLSEKLYRCCWFGAQYVSASKNIYTRSHFCPGNAGNDRLGSRFAKTQIQDPSIQTPLTPIQCITGAFLHNYTLIIIHARRQSVISFEW